MVAEDGVRGVYARRFYLGAAVILSTDEVIEGEKIEDVRAKLPDGLINLGRCDSLAPYVLEWWA